MEPSFSEQWIEHNGVGFVVREIKPDDLDEYTRVVDTQQKVMERRRNLDLDDFRSVFHRFNTDRRLNVGAFDSAGNLRSTYGMFFWASMPYVTDSGVVVDKEHCPMFNPQKSGLLHILRALYSYSEHLGYYHHYSVRYAKHFDRELKTWDKYTTEFRDRYERYKEAIIPADTKPDWPAYWRIMGEQTYPYDIMIQYVRLKEEHRGT